MEIDPWLNSRRTIQKELVRHSSARVEAMMRGERQLQRVCALHLALAAAWACGGGAEVTQPGSQSAAGSAANAGPNAPQGNADALVVPMSMIIPKKPVMPPPMTAPSFPQIPPGAAAGAAPGAGAPTTPGGAAPTGMPGAPGTAPTGTTPTTPAAGAAGAPATGTMTAAAGGAAPASSGTAAGAETSGVPPEELNELRDKCVAEINMYRATLTDKMLMPLKRATAEQEECSQRGAKMDGDTMQAHGAARAGLCQSVGLSAENTCPGYPVGGGFGGAATIWDALKGCLQQMWAEGEPPVSRQECQQDYEGCFLKHGHYLNMSDPSLGSVACSAYKMSDGRSYWLNQDFAFSGGGRWGGMR